MVSIAGVVAERRQERLGYTMPGARSCRNLSLMFLRNRISSDSWMLCETRQRGGRAKKGDRLVTKDIGGLIKQKKLVRKQNATSTFSRTVADRYFHWLSKQHSWLLASFP